MLRQLGFFGVAATTAALSLFAIGGTASADQGGALNPDPDAYCVSLAQTLSFQTNETYQVNDPDVLGDYGENDFKCSFSVSASVPVPEGGDYAEGEDADESDFGFLLPEVTAPIDWADMCSSQFPGSSLQWIPGPEVGVDGAPWECIGDPGGSYGPESSADGTTTYEPDAGNAGW